jgi:ComF family protein
MWRKTLHGCLDLIAPEHCPGCDHAEWGGGFCGACEPLLEPVVGTSQDDRTAFLFQGPMAEALRRLKYRGRTDLAPALARAALARAELEPGFDAALAVPLHARRLRQRGYNQSQLLAVQIARRVGLPMASRLLQRRRPTLAQVGLSRSDRATNVQGAFRVNQRAFSGQAASGLRLLLVDDVRTSGATLAEARRALLEAGAERVVTLAVAQARDDGTTEM